MSRSRLHLLLGMALALSAGLPAFGAATGGCGVVDLGDNIVPPANQLDEDFFYCQVMPNVIVAQGCAVGLATDTGGCHATQSALLLEDAAGVAPPACDPMTNRLLEPAPDIYVRNLTRVRFTVASDPMSSPFYRRPLGMDSHPRVIYDRGSPEEMIVRAWITGGGT